MHQRRFRLADATDRQSGRKCHPLWSRGGIINVTLSSDKKSLFRLEIADQGPGIPEEDRDRVFRRFVRLDQSRNTPGHGLGLPLVRAIAKLHGAQITLLDNHPGLIVRVEFRG
ncbi:ATP-binding protein [Acidocella sp. MX-AZ03]|uniref:ATP-binding protein n=1 Tax=Acidocella sp. MX-AZ03 TaxID=2697363 RepID=UPI003FA42DD6